MKTNKKLHKNIKKLSSDVGITIMTLATVIGLVDIPEHINRAVLVPVQPTRYSNYNQSNEDSNPIRREKEESATEYVSYSEAERTPSRSKRF